MIDFDIKKMTMRQFLEFNKAFFYASAGKDFTTFEEKALKAMTYLKQGNKTFAMNELQAIHHTSKMIQQQESPYVDIVSAFRKREDVLNMTVEECMQVVEDVKKKCIIN